MNVNGTVSLTFGDGGGLDQGAIEQIAQQVAQQAVQQALATYQVNWGSLQGIPQNVRNAITDASLRPLRMLLDRQSLPPDFNLDNPFGGSSVFTVRMSSSDMKKRITMPTDAPSYGDVIWTITYEQQFEGVEKADHENPMEDWRGIGPTMQRLRGAPKTGGGPSEVPFEYVRLFNTWDYGVGEYLPDMQSGYNLYQQNGPQDNQWSPWVKVF